MSFRDLRSFNGTIILPTLTGIVGVDPEKTRGSEDRTSGNPSGGPDTKGTIRESQANHQYC